MVKSHHYLNRMIPSEEVGEYSKYEEKCVGPLFPLEEEGEYGTPPQYKSPGKWNGPPKYLKREKKPKMYASYAVSSECQYHGHKINKYQRGPDSRSTSGSRPSSRMENDVARWTRSVSVPPVIEATKEELTEKKRTRLLSLPATSVYSPSQDGLDELIGRLKISRTISEDLEDSLMDKSEDLEGDVFRIQTSQKKVGNTNGALNMKLLREENTATYMHSTGSVLKEEPMTTYVV